MHCISKVYLSLYHSVRSGGLCLVWDMDLCLCDNFAGTMGPFQSPCCGLGSPEGNSFSTSVILEKVSIVPGMGTQEAGLRLKRRKTISFLQQTVSLQEHQPAGPQGASKRGGGVPQHGTASKRRTALGQEGPRNGAILECTPSSQFLSVVKADLRLLKQRRPPCWTGSPAISVV
jgi:hypothetical protein